jgi:hypothetical protein
MRLRVVLLTSVLAAGWLTSGCGSKTDRITPPTSAGPTDPAGSADRGPVPPNPPAPPPASGSCDAAKAQWAIGERESNDLLERARVAAGAGSARFLRPNQPITMEYNGSRLNLGLNEQDVVRSVTCG